MKRIRLIIAGAVVVAATLGVAANPAHAAGESEEQCLIEAVQQYKDGDIDKAALEGEVTACKQAPNQLLPETNEIIWGGLAFLIVFIFLWKVGMPVIKQGMAARAERIQNDLDQAETQRTEASTILEEYKAQLADARQESARIIEEARQAADSVRSDLQAKAEADIAEMRARAAADIESAKAQAIADLRGEVTALAIGAAEQVVGRNLDQETNAALVEAYINSVGADR